MKLKTKGLTLVPLKMYFKHGKVKVEIGTATGKKLYDKRQDMAEKAAKRDLDRRIKTQRLDWDCRREVPLGEKGANHGADCERGP